MPPLVAQAFWPFDHPLVGRLVVLGGGADRRDVGAGVGLRGAEGGDLGVVGVAEALRDPLAHLLRGPLPEDRGDGQRGAHDRHPDAGVAPEQLLVGDRQSQAGLVGEELAQRFEAVEADLGGLLDHRPGSLLALVPFGRGGTDDALGEAVHPIADVLLVLVQLERELRALAVAAVSGRLGDRLLCLCHCRLIAHAANTTQNDVVFYDDVAQVERAQPLGAAVGAVEEAPVDAVVLAAAALVGPLDRERAVRQRLAGHLHAAEAAGLQHRVELDLGAEDLLHAADVLDAGQRVEVAVEEAAAHLDAAARLDHLVAEGAAAAALACLGPGGRHTPRV